MSTTAAPPQPLDADGEALYVRDFVEPLRRSPNSTGDLFVVAFYEDGTALLSDGLTIRTSDLRYTPKGT